MANAMELVCGAYIVGMVFTLTGVPISMLRERQRRGVDRETRARNMGDAILEVRRECGVFGCMLLPFLYQCL